MKPPKKTRSAHRAEGGAKAMTTPRKAMTENEEALLARVVPMLFHGGYSVAEIAKATGQESRRVEEWIRMAVRGKP